MVLLHCLQKCFGPLLRHVAHSDDTKDDRLRKTLVVPFSFSAMILMGIFTVYSAVTGPSISTLSPFLLFAINASVLGYVSITKHCTPQVAGCYALSAGCWSVANDVWTFGLVDYYTTSVLVMDGLLLCNCHRHYTTLMMTFTLTVIVFSAVEQTTGIFGVYQAIPESWTGYTRPEEKDTSLLLNLLLQRVFVFCGDYAMTRYFSKGMREQREQVERSVVVAQRIAVALARFDLDKAQEMVEGAEGLPLELLDALTCLLGNLRSYRHYLPQSCLPDEAEGVDDTQECSISPVSSSKFSGSLLIEYEQHTLHRRSCTLVALNVCNFMRLVGDIGEAATVDFHTSYISHVLEAAKSTKGLVEHFVCDRVLVSFNATRLCASHRMQGLLCVDRVRAFASGEHTRSGTALSMAISSGDVLSGSLGCDGLRSYSLVGLLAAWVPVLERVAVQLGVAAITDSTISSHTREACHFRLLGNAVFAKQPGREMVLFEFVAVKEVHNEEWMYQLARHDPWEDYNEALRLLSRGDPLGAQCLSRNLPPSDRTSQLASKIERAAADSKHYKMYWEVRDVGLLEVKTEVSIGFGQQPLPNQAP